jgi:hypothetical protein
MEKIIEKSERKITRTQTKFVRSAINDINWDARLIGLKGARGVGKTTLLLQYIKLNLMEDTKSTLYVSLDDIWFTRNQLVDLVEVFVKLGGRYLFLDEVHKYPNWSVEIKNIYDDYPELKVVFTGSSLLEILNARADLSRRAIVYNIQGLSLREYISIKSGIEIQPYTINEIVENHLEISKQINAKIKPLQYYFSYIKEGYYPFFKEQPELYFLRLEEVINMILEIELPLLRNINIGMVNRIKQLLLIIAESAPFIPNISKLAEKIDINRETLSNYLFYLNESNIIHSAYKNPHGISKLQKPEKIFMENTNLMYAFGTNNINIGNVRETFFLNQLKYKHQINLSSETDFIVDDKFSFEIGGKNKTRKQIIDSKNTFIASDDIEYGFQNKIPLWMFGLMY